MQVNTSALNDSNPRISGNMVFGIESVQAHIEPNDQAQPAYRPPQVPIEVEGYPITPDGLELEQVHIYVRHGEHCASLLNNHYNCCIFRWTYTSWCTALPASCIDSRTLDDVQNGPEVPSCCIWNKWKSRISTYGENGRTGGWNCFG